MGCLKLTYLATEKHSQIHESPLKVVYNNPMRSEKSAQGFIRVDPLADHPNGNWDVSIFCILYRTIQLGTGMIQTGALDAPIYDEDPNCLGTVMTIGYKG